MCSPACGCVFIWVMPVPRGRSTERGSETSSNSTSDALQLPTEWEHVDVRGHTRGVFFCRSGKNFGSRKASSGGKFHYSCTSSLTVIFRKLGLAGTQEVVWLFISVVFASVDVVILSANCNVVCKDKEIKKQNPLWLLNSISLLCIISTQLQSIGFGSVASVLLKCVQNMTW